MNSEIYRQAQRAMADLKAAAREAISLAEAGGLTNAELGRGLGIYAGHAGHEGHISRTLLAMLEAEGVVQQDEETKRWTLKRPGQ